MRNYLNDIDDAIGKSGRILPKVLEGYKPIEGGEYTMYKKYSGGYCVVYPLSCPNKPNKCIRFWYKESNKENVRFLAGQLTKLKLENNELAFLIDYEYFEEGLKLDFDLKLGKQEIIPAVVMDWIDGDTLNDYIKKNISSPLKLKQLADGFLSITSLMNRKGLAHGDLSSDNIIVTPNNKIMLIDYDSFYIKGKSIETNQTTKGTPGYQHPERMRQKHLSENMDYFSQQVIYLSILAVAEKPILASMNNMFLTDRKMFFDANDFANESNFITSDGYKAIASIENQEIKSRLSDLRYAVKSALINVKPLIKPNEVIIEDSKEEIKKGPIVKNGNDIKIPQGTYVYGRQSIPIQGEPTQPKKRLIETPWFKKWYAWACAIIIAIGIGSLIINGISSGSNTNIQTIDNIGIAKAIDKIEGNYTLREKNGSTSINGIRTAAIKKMSDTEARILVTSEYGPDFYDFTFTSDGKIQSEKLGTGEIAYNERLDKITITFKEGERICEFTK